MASQNSFHTRTSLTAGGPTPTRSSACRRSRRPVSRACAAAVLAEDPAREPAAPRGRPVRQRRRHRGAGAVGRHEHGAEGDLVHAGARAAAGLHRRARVVDLAAMRDGIVAARRRSAARSTRCSRSSWSSITRCRSITSRERNAVRAERRARVLAQQGALRVPALGPDGVRQLPRRPARHRHRPPGEPRVPRARGLQRAGRRPSTLAYPDTLVGTDSHTTMVNGLGVVGWGVGGIEAEAAMLGQPISMLIPQVLGFRLTGPTARRRDGDRPRADDHRAAAQARRRRQVRRVLRARARAPDDCRSRDARQHVPGVRRDDRHLPDRRDDARLPAAHRPRRVAASQLVEAYAKAQGLFRTAGAPDPVYTEIDRARSRRPSSRASPGPKRPQDRVSLKQAKSEVPAGARGDARRARRQAAPEKPGETTTSGETEPVAAAARWPTRRAEAPGMEARSRRGGDRGDHQLHQHVEPERDDRRRPAREEGRRARAEAQAVGEDQPRAGLEGRHRVSATRPGLIEYLDELGFNLVGYGCTTCIGNSGPLPDDVSADVEDTQPRRRVGAERQPQLRGTHPAAGARELPGVAAAGRRLRARRPDDRSI